MITEAYYQNEWIEQCRSTKAKNYSPRHEAFFLGKGTKNVSIDLNHEELAKWEKWKPDTIIRKNLLGVQNTHVLCVWQKCKAKWINKHKTMQTFWCNIQTIVKSSNTKIVN